MYSSRFLIYILIISIVRCDDMDDSFMSSQRTKSALLKLIRGTALDKCFSKYPSVSGKGGDPATCNHFVSLLKCLRSNSEVTSETLQVYVNVYLDGRIRPCHRGFEELRGSTEKPVIITSSSTSTPSSNEIMVNKDIQMATQEVMMMMDKFQDEKIEKRALRSEMDSTEPSSLPLNPAKWTVSLVISFIFETGYKVSGLFHAIQIIYVLSFRAWRLVTKKCSPQAHSTPQPMTVQISEPVQAAGHSQIQQYSPPVQTANAPVDKSVQNYPPNYSQTYPETY